MLATGQRIDSRTAERFGALVDRIYQNPFKKRSDVMTAPQIVQYVLQRLEES